jgi:hypothetical protein
MRNGEKFASNALVDEKKWEKLTKIYKNFKKLAKNNKN